MTETLETFRAALTDRYTLERELGRGGMATVHLGHDLRHDRPVALKVLHPEFAGTVGPERFLREIRLAARLQHPHIVTVLDSGEAAGRLWFTMPYVEGESLRDRLVREKQLPIPDAVRITAEATGTTVGTPAYMSPEQAAGEHQLDAKIDIYSLATVLYEMLSGELPFTGPTPQAINAKRLTAEPAPLRRVRPAVPASLDQALRQALALVPADRFSSAADFARAVTDSVSAGIALPSAAETAAAPARGAAHAPAGGRTGRLRAVIVLALGVVLGLGVLFAWRQGRARNGRIESEPKRLAVLPFESTGDTSDRAFADGMTEELTARLARVPGLRLIARSSALQYRGSHQAAPAFGRELGVDYVLDGIVRTAIGPGGQKQVRITPATMIGAQASNDQLEKILSYIEIGKNEGAQVLTGGARRVHQRELEQGYYVQPTIFAGQNRMRIFQEEIFGPVLAVTRFKDMADALSIANDTLYGLGAGVWSRDVNTCYRMGRGIKAGRVWTNCYHAYPAHAAFGGYKQSGIGRENHRMMLEHYQQTKNLLVSYSPKKLGFF